MRVIRSVIALLAMALAACRAQTAATPTRDTLLVARVLQAEDNRDANDAALRQGLASTDARIHWLAWRARARIRDSAFTARDSLPRLPAPPVWPEPEWRLHYRELLKLRDMCAPILGALQHDSWPVRLRAMDLAPAKCTSDNGIVALLRRWVDELPADASRRARGEVSWHAAAHAIVALARMNDVGWQQRARRLAAHAQAEVRMYAARAARVAGLRADSARPRADTASLRILAVDPNDDVKEAAIDALSQLTGHADDDVYLRALDATGAQAVRAAANALKGSPRPDVQPRLNATFERWVAHGNASERDARVALLEAAGRPASDDRPPTRAAALPRDATLLALGTERRLRVTMSDASGGGTFVVRLRGDIAPIMAARILDLARSGYYNGGHWHRVEHDFVIQGAGPGTNEYVGYRDYLRDELGNVPHARGTVGMSTRGHDTGDAQWFVNLKDNLRLNRDYTVFGEVVEGMDVVDDILEGDVIATVKGER
jgi:cyclophilin family peptidyl-prolyl cis-trans isomerase